MSWCLVTNKDEKGFKMLKTFCQDQDQDQDFYLKTKTKTNTCVFVLEAPRDHDLGLEAPRDQDLGLEDYITDIYMHTQPKFNDTTLHCW